MAAVPASTASVVNIPLYVKDELLVPSEDDYNVSSHLHSSLTHSPHTTAAAHCDRAPCVRALPSIQSLLDGRISESEWLEDCELLQAAYDRNAILQRLRTQLHQHITRQSHPLSRLCSILSLLVCCFCLLLDGKSEQLRLTADVCRQRHAVLVAYVETMNRKYQYRQLSVSFEYDECGRCHWFAVRLQRTTPSDRAGIGEEAAVAGRHARGRSHQRQKSASLMGHSKRLLSGSSMVQVHPYLPPAIVLPADGDDAETQQAMNELF